MRKFVKNIIQVNPFRLLIAGCTLLLCVLSAQPLQAQTGTASKEYKVKAVFLLYFTQFVEWRPAAFGSANAPFVIGILGDDPFGGYIDETVNNEKVSGHPIIVQRYHDVKEIKNCQILFINSADPERMKEDIASAGTNTLTVGDAGGFVKMGGMIRFFTENNKIRLQVNPDAARAADLNISAKLLRVSDIFDPKSQPR